MPMDMDVDGEEAIGGFGFLVFSSRLML